MKIWRFYKKPDDQNDVKKRYDLYAITNHREYAEFFMNTRNMNKFYTRCTSEDKETYANIANDNRNCVLDEYELVTRSTNANGDVTNTKISMIMTFFEYQCVNGSEFTCEVMTEEWWSDSPDYKKYNKKIKNALRKLEYVSHYKIMTPYYSSLEEKDNDYSAPNIWIDEFGAFISTFKDTFK